MENICQDNFSRQLYLFLCQVIGSEKVVQSRRIFFQAMEDSLNCKNDADTFITSGSKAEGLDMSGSDIDLMTVIKPIPVFHSYNMTKYEYDNRCLLLADTEHAPPGFVYLRGISGFNANDIVCACFTLSEYGTVLSSEKFINYMRLQFPHGSIFQEMFKIHGPCIMPLNMYRDVDIAYCLKSETWPTIAAKWLHRPHHSGWPSSIVLEMMASSGSLYVPIGKKFVLKPSHPLQWRISFSIQEKILVCSFNHTQLLCYALLKLILKEFINTKHHVSDLLCSYFIKTTVFWVSEDIRISDWKPENLFQCVQSCIKRLMYFVRLENCPNYFIPENNMIEGKLHGTKQKDLLSVLESLDDKNIISKLPTLKHFDPTKDVFSVNIEQNEIDIAIYPHLELYILFSAVKPLSRYITTLLSKIRNQRSNLYKALYFQWLSHYYIKALTKMPYNWQYKNKHFYQQYKQFRFYALIGKNVDTVSGWLWLALFMYQHGDYQSVLTLTSSVLQECTPDKIYISGNNSLTIDSDILCRGNLTFLERHKICCIYKLLGNWAAKSVFFKCHLFELHVIANPYYTLSFVDAPPIVFLHFLRFWCFHQIGNIFERNKCITDIEHTIEEDFFVDSMIAYKYLLEALYTSQKYHLIPGVLLKAWRVFEQSPHRRDIIEYIPWVVNFLQNHYSNE